MQMQKEKEDLGEGVADGLREIDDRDGGRICTSACAHGADDLLKEGKSISFLFMTILYKE